LDPAKCLKSEGDAGSSQTAVMPRDGRRMQTPWSDRVSCPCSYGEK